MVVFTCGHCGESLQKPKVEKHYLTKCRNKNPNLSCMDCFKDFYGNDYEGHTKCITEEQRYSAKGFVAKEKKGEQKQNVWVEMLQSVLDEKKDAPKNVLRILETVSKHNNTPRKKPKFYNFVKNVCGSKTGAKDIEAAWDLLAVKLTEMANQRNQEQKENKPNGEVNGIDKPQDINKANDDSIENGTDDKGEENNEEAKTNGDTEVVDQKKTKKQLKEEKKRKKYEAELKSAAEAPAEDDNLENDEALSKKDKKKKNRTKSASEADAVAAEEEDSNNKKRKRQITVSGSSEPGDIKVEQEEIKPVTEKTKKKKPKVVEETDENLHDQNVAKGEEQCVTSGKFNWHAVIMSVLEKKGNEIPFKRLQKKVLGEYYEATGQDIDDRIADKFIKKLKSAPNVRVDKNRVILVD